MATGIGPIDWSGVAGHGGAGARAYDATGPLDWAGVPSPTPAAPGRSSRRVPIDLPPPTSEDETRFGTLQHKDLPEDLLAEARKLGSVYITADEWYPGADPPWELAALLQSRFHQHGWDRQYATQQYFGTDFLDFATWLSEVLQSREWEAEFAGARYVGLEFFHPEEYRIRVFNVTFESDLGDYSAGSAPGRRGGGIGDVFAMIGELIGEIFARRESTRSTAGTFSSPGYDIPYPEGTESQPNSDRDKDQSGNTDDDLPDDEDIRAPWWAEVIWFRSSVSVVTLPSPDLRVLRIALAVSMVKA
jgi:hypothetical protein